MNKTSKGKVLSQEQKNYKAILLIRELSGQIDELLEPFSFKASFYSKLNYAHPQNPDLDVEAMSYFLASTMQRIMAIAPLVRKMKQRIDRISLRYLGYKAYTNARYIKEQSYFGYIYYSEQMERYFYGDAPISEKLVEYMLQHKIIKKAGRYFHQGTKHERYQLMADDSKEMGNE